MRFWWLTIIKATICLLGIFCYLVLGLFILRHVHFLFTSHTTEPSIFVHQTTFLGPLKVLIFPLTRTVGAFVELLPCNFFSRHRWFWFLQMHLLLVECVCAFECTCMPVHMVICVYICANVCLSVYTCVWLHFFVVFTCLCVHICV